MSGHDDAYFMNLAVEACRRGIDTGQSPFGACIVAAGRVVACEHNQVWQTTDITAHAEVTAIRVACRVLNSVNLSGCDIYTTTEPCPMCFSAIHWARIGRIVYGATISDAKSYGFNELTIPATKMNELNGAMMKVTGPCLYDECHELFNYWQSQAGHRSY